jgi:outer membrane lipopolysaccharide assembly protein LptE/RlpB
MSLSTKLLILAVMLALGFASGWHFRGNEDAGTTLAEQKQEMKQGNLQNAADAKAAQGHEVTRQQADVHDRIVIQQVAVAAAAPDYHTCQLKPDDLDLLNQAIGGNDVSQGK